MKSNRSFLEGVYSKAEILQKEVNKQRLRKKMYYRFASVAAMIVLIPTIYFMNNNLEYREIQKPMYIRTVDHPLSYFDEAEFIVSGQTKEIKESRYIKDRDHIYTDIVYTIDKVFLGNMEKTEIVIRVDGGKVKSERVYQNIESKFIEGQRSLVFLYEEEGIYYLVRGDSQFTQIERDEFIDKQGNYYDLEKIEEIINNGGRSYEEDNGTVSSN